jgi:capsular exopolysaccharide synthesis family protein
MAQIPNRSAETGASAGPASSDWNLTTLKRILWQRRWLIAAIAAEVFLITGLVTFLRTPLYEASARVMIERATPKVLDSEDVVPVVWNEFEIQRFYQTQYLLVKDPAVLEQALDRDGLRELLLAELAPEDEARDDAPAPPDDEALAKWIRSQLSIQQLEYSNVIRVSFRHPSPEVAARVVNAIVYAYRDFFVAEGLEARRGATTFLGEQIKDMQAAVLELEKQLLAERRRLGPVLSAGGSGMNRSRLESLDARLTDAKAQLAQAGARATAYENAQPMSLEEVRSNPQVLRFLENLAQLKRERAELEGRVGRDWPRMRELNRAIEETKQDLEREAGRIYQQALESARQELQLARQNEDRLAALFEQELATATDLESRSQNYDRLAREYEQKKGALDRLLARREEVAVSENLASVLRRQVSIVAEATPPESPAVPRVKLNLALGLAFGMFLGVAAAFLAEALDNKVRSAAQLGELTGLPVLGSVPRVNGPTRPRLIFSRKRSGTTPVMAARQNDAEESFRALRSSLMLSQAGHPPRSLLVTSALPGEGKSTVAANLGRTLAAFGSKTVLIDADLRHPRLHRLFDSPREVGLTNVLATSAPVGEVLVKTRFENLYVIPGGPCPPDPATLLDVSRLRAIIEELTEEHGFDFVLVDSPPTLVFADSFNIVPAVEGVMLVARALQTPKEAIRQARDALRKVNAPITGVLLNGEGGEDSSGSYYRYYHYRKGYYRKAAEERRTEADRRTPEPDTRSDKAAG